MSAPATSLKGANGGRDNAAEDAAGAQALLARQEEEAHEKVKAQRQSKLKALFERAKAQS